jgi:hypothetical protein
MKVIPNTYKKLSNGAWGANVMIRYCLDNNQKIEAGATITITTKNGEKQNRIIDKIITKYRDGNAVVSLIADENVERMAQQRYNEKVNASSCAATGQSEEKKYDLIWNEGGEGYNPHRGVSIKDCLKSDMPLYM